MMPYKYKVEFTRRAGYFVNPETEEDRKEKVESFILESEFDISNDEDKTKLMEQARIEAGHRG
jgi:hypothetical protein